MGGFGSGRPQNSRLTTRDAFSLDVRRLQRRELLAPGQQFDLSWTVNGNTVATIAIRTEVDRLIFSHRGRRFDSAREPMAYSVDLDRTPCMYGGRRAWFLCPGKGCRRRVAKLYFVGAGVCACRHCYQLVYECQAEAEDYRAIRKADVIRDRLGWQAGIFNERGGKPRGMHTATYERMVSRHDALVDMVLNGQVRWSERLETRLNKLRRA
jgi:hypothetical protein